MFTSLPKLIDKQFIIGFILPLACFALGAAFVFQPQILPRLGKALLVEKDLGDVAVIAALLWLGAVALMMLNRVLHRLLCGYYAAWLLAPFLCLEKRRRQRLDAAIKAALDANGQLLPTASKAEYNEHRHDFVRAFSNKPGDTLPTRLGNAVRAYERYANQAYGVDGIMLWPRLAPVLSAEIRGQVSDGRAQLDCFTNLTLLSAALGLWALIYWLAALALHPPQDASLGWTALVALVLARLFYMWAIERALTLGDAVRAAFDLGLPVLLGELSYGAPSSRVAQTALLKEINNTYFYFEPVKRPWKLKS